MALRRPLVPPSCSGETEKQREGKRESEREGEGVDIRMERGQRTIGQREGRPCGEPPHAIEPRTKTQHSPPRKASSPNEERK